MSLRSLSVIRSVWKREFISAAASPAPWIFLIIFLVLIGFLSFMVSGIFTYGQADLSPFFAWFPWLFLFLIPALGMPLWSEERRTGTFELLYSFPATLRELVWGKFLAGMTLTLIALILSMGIPLSAFFLGEPDPGSVLCGYAGTFLLGGLFLSVTLFCSALTESQTASFLLAMVTCSLFMTVGTPEVLDALEIYLPEQVLHILSYIAFLPHYHSFQRGFLNSSDLVYCLAGTVFFLYLTENILQFISSGSGNIFAPGFYRERSSRNALIRFLLKTLFALYALFCLNLAGNSFSVQYDASSDGAYSLSPETGSFARNLKKNAEIRFYASRSSSKMPEAFRRYAERIQWLLKDLCAKSGSKLVLTVLDPQTDSAEEQAAYLEGIKPLQIHSGERIYLGLSVSCADRYIPIPFLSMQQEKLLEYEIVRAIMNATNSSKPKIGVMSAFKVTGDRLPEQLTQLDAEKPKVYERSWYVISELANDCEIVELPLDLPQIPSDLAALLVIHPAGIKERTLYALDQYLMNGGKMAVFLDPRSFYAVIKTRSDYSMIHKISSSLEPLTGAWGVAYNPNMIAADLLFAHRRTLPDRMVTNPAALELTSAALNQENPVTARFNTLSMWFASVLDFKEIKGLQTKVLIHTSPNSQMVSSYVGERPELVLRHFRPSGQKLPLALQLSGNFPSAYPAGPPVLMGKGHIHKKESAGKGMVYLFGDSDMLFNDLVVKNMPDAYGQQTVVRQNDNCSLLQNVMEQLTDTDSVLKQIRSRKPMQRPLTRYNELRAKAELAYKDRIRDLERDLLRARAGEKKIRQKLKNSPGGKQPRLTEEERRILHRFENSRARVQRELREIRKQLRADLNALDTKLRLINMVLLPLIVALCGLLWAFLRFSKWRKRKGKLSK